MNKNKKGRNNALNFSSRYEGQLFVQLEFPMIFSEKGNNNLGNLVCLFVCFFFLFKQHQHTSLLFGCAINFWIIHD